LPRIKIVCDGEFRQLEDVFEHFQNGREQFAFQFLVPVQIDLPTLPPVFPPVPTWFENSLLA
jgi:hypothetical protein